MRLESPRDGQNRGAKRRAGKRRLAFAMVIVVAVAIAVSLAIGLSGSRIGSNSTTTAKSTGHSGSTVAASTRTVIAWNPSHQDDTGPSGWHEYAISGDIAKRTMTLLPGFTNVLCWRTDMGLTSSGDAALRAECEKANTAHAQVFIAVHVDGGAASGVSGDYYAGDSASARYAEALLRSVAATMGMAFLSVRPRLDLLVLKPVNNKAPIRVLLELGDNVADRALLTSAKGRQRLATALAEAVKENTPSTFR
jgi:N-acetylmuramoyl-L-alanine amidase